MNGRNSGGWEEGIVALVIGIVVLTAVIIAIVVYAIFTELWKIYSTRAIKPSVVRRFLLIALAVFGLAWLLAFILMAIPATAVLGVYLLTASFSVWVLAAVGAEFYARQRDAAEPTSELGIEHILQPWEYDEPRRIA